MCLGFACFGAISSFIGVVVYSSFLILGLTSFLDPVLTMLLCWGGGSGKSININQNMHLAEEIDSTGNVMRWR